MACKTVAVIGAGVSGLASIKAAIEAGFEATAYERDAWLGGVWNYTEDERFCIPKSTILNTSKHFTCFSDYPISKETPNFMTVDVYQKYLESYAKEFDLTRRIRFGCEVVEVKKCLDYEQTGRWEVHSRPKDSKDDVGERVEVYDFVMVCSGIYNKPFISAIPGIEGFAGTVIHSKAYRTFTGFEDKRVLVIGLGNSAGDIACDLSRHTAQVYLSTRRGSWILPRCGTGGQPIGFFGLTRFISSMPKKIFHWAFLQKLKSGYDLAKFGLEPQDLGSAISVIMNDELPHRIVTGSIIVKTEIEYIKDKQVFFKDGTRIDDLDNIVFATGFDVMFPFLSKSIFNPNTKSHQYYKAVFPPDLSHSSLAMIGVFRVYGSVVPVAEIQARWAALVFQGKCLLPSKQMMEKDILSRQQHGIDSGIKKTAKADSMHYLLSEGIISYMDDIAALAGVKPNLCKLFFQDPWLSIKCFFGPCIPAQYRLTGPYNWSGSEMVIRNVKESFLTPLRTRQVKRNTTSSKSGLYFCVMVAVFIVLLIAINR